MGCYQASANQSPKHAKVRRSHRKLTPPGRRAAMLAPYCTSELRQLWERAAHGGPQAFDFKRQSRKLAFPRGGVCHFLKGLTSKACAPPTAPGAGYLYHPNAPNSTPVKIPYRITKLLLELVDRVSRTAPESRLPLDGAPCPDIRCSIRVSSHQGVNGAPASAKTAICRSKASSSRAMFR